MEVSAANDLIMYFVVLILGVLGGWFARDWFLYLDKHKKKRRETSA